MTSTEFNHNRELFNSYCESLLKTKGDDYTKGESDRLSNFKDVASELGVDPMIVWYVYFRKHIHAIASRIRTGKVESEPIEGRFADARNYLDLGLALMVEGEETRRELGKVAASPPSSSSPLEVEAQKVFSYIPYHGIFKPSAN